MHSIYNYIHTAFHTDKSVRDASCYIYISLKLSNSCCYVIKNSRYFRIEAQHDSQQSIKDRSVTLGIFKFAVLNGLYIYIYFAEGTFIIPSITVICTHTCTHMHVHAYMYAHIHHVYVRVYECMHVRVYVYYSNTWNNESRFNTSSVTPRQ